MAEQSDKSKKIEGAQREAQTRPVIGGKSQDLRQVELDRQLNLSKIQEANARLAGGTITMEEYDKLTGRQ